MILIAQRQTLYNELLFFINMSHVEQEFQIKDQLPTIEEYQERRMGSSAVRVCLAMTEPVQHNATICCC